MEASVEDILFFMGYALLLIWRIVLSSVLAFPEGSFLNTCIHIIVLGLLFASTVSAFRNHHGLSPYFSAIILGIVIKICTGSMLFFDLSILLLAARGRSFRSICVATILISGITIAVIVGLALGGVIENYPFTRGDKIRWGLGFRWTTLLSHYYLNLVMVYFYIRKTRITAIELVAVLTIDFLIYHATNSRNSFILVLVIVAAAILYRSSSKTLRLKMNPLKKMFAQYAPIILVIGFFAASAAYSPESTLLRNANEVMSNRLQQTHESIQRYGLKPFGSEIEWAAKGVIDMGEDAPSNKQGDVNYVDNSFIELLLNEGYIPFLFVMGWIIAAGAWAAKHEGWFVCLCLFVIALHSTLDPQLLLVEYNTFLFLIMRMSIGEISSWKSRRLQRPEEY